MAMRASKIRRYYWNIVDDYLQYLEEFSTHRLKGYPLAEADKQLTCILARS
jgi:hypothetical protein